MRVLCHCRQALIVPESIAVGKRIFRMPAHDCDAEDAGLLSYGLRSKTNSHPDAQFRIDSKGWITIASPLDREETPSYNLTVFYSILLINPCFSTF